MTTNPSPSNPKLLPVEQRHRDAAAEMLNSHYAGSPIDQTKARIRAGQMDSHNWVQAFARFEAEHLNQRSNLPSDGAVGERWTSGVTHDNRAYIQDEDFTFDARLYIDGDFPNDHARNAYRDRIRTTLTRLAAGREADAKQLERAEETIRAWQSAVESLEAHIMDRANNNDPAKPETYLSILRGDVADVARTSEQYLAARWTSYQRQQERIEADAKRIEALEGALAFYADPETYHACAFLFDRPTGGFDEDFDEDHGHEDYDRPMPGKRARQALSPTPGKDG